MGGGDDILLGGVAFEASGSVPELVGTPGGRTTAPHRAKQPFPGSAVDGSLAQSCLTSAQIGVPTVGRGLEEALRPSGAVSGDVRRSAAFSRHLLSGRRLGSIG